MIIPDSKKIATSFLSKLSPKGGVSGGTDMKTEETMGADAPLHAIAEDMILAMTNKSAGDLVVALKAFRAMDVDSDDDGGADAGADDGDSFGE